MSLTTIPNQPINFADPEVYAKCRDIEPPLTISLEDKMVFQFLQDRCPDAEQFLEPIGPSEWIDNPGWTIGTGLLSLVTGNGLSDVNESSFAATIGTTYEVEVFVQSVQGNGVFVVVGGVQVAVNAPGLHKWTVTATSTQGARAVSISDNSAIVITSFEVWEANRSFTVAFVGPDSTVEYDPVNDPEFFQYIGQHVVFIAPVPEGFDDCFHMELRDECLEEAVVYCSQSIKVIGCEGTLMFRVCLDTAGLGFAPGYFTLRSPSSLTNPVWEYDTAEERLSNGFINRYYIDRQSLRTLSIESVSKHLHPFLAAMAMFDHFYIGEVAYSIDADTYQPSYGEGQTGSGSVTLNVRKKMELVRRVLCDDLGPGCNPANDPICPEANAVVGTEYSEGTLFAFVEVFSNLGFFVSEARWFLNGVEQTPLLVAGAPGKYALGAVVPGDTVRVVFVDNQSEQECTDDRGTFTVQSPCEIDEFPEGCQHFTFDVVNVAGVEMQIRATPDSATEYVTIIAPNGEVQVINASATASYVVFGESYIGGFCAYSSDENGNPFSGEWVRLFLLTSATNGITNIDLSSVILNGNSAIADDGLGFERCVLSSPPDFTYMTTLRYLSFGRISLPLLPVTTGLDLRGYLVQDCGISIAPSLTAFPNLTEVSFSQNNLPSSEVDRVVNEVSAFSTQGSGSIYIDLQTPPAPRTSASDAAVADLQGRTPGWLIVTD